MKVLVVYNSLDPQSVAGAAICKLRYDNTVLMDIKAVTTGNITTAINALTAIHHLVIINYTVTTAGTGVISPAQVILLDAKTVRTVVKSGQATASASDATLTQSTMGAVVNAYQNMYVKTTGGTGLNQVRKILTNSTTVLTLESAWTTPIDNTTTYSICATREEFSYTIEATSGQIKRAWLAWEHAKFFPLTPKPLVIAKLAGDKTTADTATNAQGVLDESYITKATKYFLRDITDAAVMLEWRKLLFNTEDPDPTKTKVTNQDTEGVNSTYGQIYKRGKLLVESATALSVTI